MSFSFKKDANTEQVSMTRCSLDEWEGILRVKSPFLLSMHQYLTIHAIFSMHSFLSSSTKNSVMNRGGKGFTYVHPIKPFHLKQRLIFCFHMQIQYESSTYNRNFGIWYQLVV